MFIGTRKMFQSQIMSKKLYEIEINRRIKYISEYYNSSDQEHYLKNNSDICKYASTAPCPDYLKYDYTRHGFIFEKHGLDKDFCAGKMFDFWSIDL